MSQTYMIPARYMEQHALESFLGSLFGYGQAQVTWTRGSFQCTLPRALTEQEMDALKHAVDFGHYDES